MGALLGNPFLDMTEKGRGGRSGGRALNVVALIAGIAVAIGVVAVYAVFDPNEVYFPKCPVKLLTGLDCPGCGSQRALHALLHGDVAAAVGFNALLVAAIPLLTLLTVAEMAPVRLQRLRYFLNSRGFILSVLAVIVAWTVARNIWLR